MMQELWGRRHHQAAAQPAPTQPLYQNIDSQVNAYVQQTLNTPTTGAQPVFSLVDQFVVDEPRYVLEQPGVYDVYAPKSGFDAVAAGTTTTQAGGNYQLGAEPINVQYNKINNVADANLSVSGNAHKVTEVKTLENDGNISFTLLVL